MQQSVELLDEKVDLECDALIKSIGYRSIAMHGVPFDSRKAVIPHEHGCVLGEDG